MSKLYGLIQAENALNTVYEDLKMLESGAWVPDPDSTKATIDTLTVVADYMGIKLKVGQYVATSIKDAKK